MFIARLFDGRDPSRQIAARALVDGEFTIGRDPGAWLSLDDPSSEISRLHGTLIRRGAEISLRDQSANGIFVEGSGERLPAGEPYPLYAGDSVQLGKFILRIDRFAGGPVETAVQGNRVGLVRSAAEQTVNWSMATQPSTAAQSQQDPLSVPSDGDLLEAFCAGAGMDMSMFGAEDPTELMHRLGAVYRQLVIGLGDLMSDRVEAKHGYDLEHTTIGAEGNNPFKWAPADRVAIDLLRSQAMGFLTGPDALRDCFADLKNHLQCLIAGSDAAVAAALERLRPERIAAEVKGRPILNKSAAAWKHLQQVHASLSAEVEQGESFGQINRAFQAGYQQRLDELGDSVSGRAAC